MGHAVNGKKFFKAKKKQKQFAKNGKKNTVVKKQQGGAVAETKRETKRESKYKPQHGEQRASLPISRYATEIETAIRTHRVVIVSSETGSGKTTQIPQYIGEMWPEKKVAITQPRRVAAMTVAQRVAEEVGCALGDKVGYSVRFEEKYCRKTQLKFMTDGMLVRAAMLSPSLEPFSTIVLDEAHERTLSTDILFGIVKRAMALRKDLRVVVMSATLDVALFTAFFEPFAPTVLNIPGRTHAVQVYYTPTAQEDYLDAALVTTIQLHMDAPHEDKTGTTLGSILIFLTGQEDIENLSALLVEYNAKLPPHVASLEICPIFAAMPPAAQMQAFAPPLHGHRKIILATNIAETSITINGVRYVIDTGLVKQRSYVVASGMEKLAIEPVSQAQAWQRSGRAGREAPGACYRLYTEDQFEALRYTAIAQIKRVNLEVVVLQLKCMGVTDIMAFDFIEPPQRAALLRALERLYALDALSNTGGLTKIGQQMAQLPLSPIFSKMLLSAISEWKCAQEMLTIVSMLSVDSLFYSPPAKRDEAIKVRRKFHSFDGDHIMLLQVYLAYQETPYDARSLWCSDHFINARAFRRVDQIRSQLLGHLGSIPHLDKASLDSSCWPNVVPIARAVTCGGFLHAAVLTRDDQHKFIYKPLIARGTSVPAGLKLHPSSVLFQKPPLPQYIIYNELIQTTRPYVRTVLRIERDWLIESLPKFFSAATLPVNSTVESHAA